MLSSSVRWATDAILAVLIRTVQQTCGKLTELLTELRVESTHGRRPGLLPAEQTFPFSGYSTDDM